MIQYLIQEIMIKSYLLGECSQVVTALGCDSSIRGFDSRHSPFFQSFKYKLNIKTSFRYKFIFETKLVRMKFT